MSVVYVYALAVKIKTKVFCKHSNETAKILFFVKMIEISAKLLRNQSAVFLCGETVEVFITISNHTLPEQLKSQSNL